jgi:hypothetical protein
MIELRPSDVMKAQVENQNKVFDILGMVIGKVAEAEKVNQVNNGLTTLMRSESVWQDQQRTRVYDRQPEYGGGSGQDVGEVQKVDFGHATEFEVKAAHDKFIKEQREFILGTATHPGAKKELAFHLDQQGVTSYQRTRQDWRTVKQHTAIADLDKLSGSVMQSGLPWDQKVAAIGSRVEATVRAGDMWPEVGEEYVQKVTETAQDMEAFAGSLAAMRETGSAEAGINWLEENTPYWDGAPEKREKAAEIVQGKFDKWMKQQEEKQEIGLVDTYVKANTTETVQQAIIQLHANKMVRGKQLLDWDTKLLAKLERLKKAETEPADDTLINSMYSRLYTAIDGNRNPAFELPIKEINERVTDATQHQAVLAKRNELQREYESGQYSTKEEVLLSGYDIVFHPNMSTEAKQKWVDDHVKAGGGLSAEDGNKLRSWIDPYNDNKDRKDAMDAITNAYHLSMANQNVGTQGKKDLEYELYNARNAMEGLFLDPKTTKADIQAAVAGFLDKQATADLQDLIKRATGGKVDKFATGEYRPKYREATAFEYLREQGKLPAETAAQFPQDTRPKAEQLEKDALDKAGIKTSFTERMPSGDLVYSTQKIVRGGTGKMLKSDTGGQGTLYQVRYQVKNGTYIPTVYTQNPETGYFDVIAWEWK